MAIKSNPGDHWIYGNLEERVIVLAIIAMVALSPIVMWFHW